MICRVISPKAEVITDIDDGDVTMVTTVLMILTVTTEMMTMTLTTIVMIKIITEKI